MNELDHNIDPNNRNERKKFPLEHFPPRLFIVLTLFVVFFTYQILGGLLSASFMGLDDLTNIDVTLTRILTSFSQFMFILAPVLFLSYLQGNNFTDTFKLKKPNVPILILSILGIILILPSIEAYMYFQEKLLYSLPLGDGVLQAIKDIDTLFEEMTLKLVVSYSIPELIGVIFVIAVTPAICEEFFFRGLILKNFERSFRPAPAILYTGVLFAIFHFHPLNIVPLIFLGYFLTFVVHYSGSIYTGVIAHFINNAVAVLAVYFIGADSMDSTTIGGEDEFSIIIQGIISLVIVIIIMVIIKKISISRKINSSIPESLTPPDNE